MLKLVYSNRTEELLNAFVRDVAQLRAATGPLDPVVVVVPNRNVETFLRFGLARRTGIAANLDVRYLRRFLRSLAGRRADLRVVDGEALEAMLLSLLLDEEVLADSIGVEKATLLNDLEAAAYGTLHLSLDEKHVLNPGTSRRKRGNIAVIAAGTGLGEAILFFDGQKYQPIASEGGHSDFAPQSDVEVALHHYLREKFHGHVSYERVLSGPGFFNVYSFFRDTGHAPEPDWLAEKIRQGDSSAVVSEVGLAGQDENCVATLDLFSTIYGAEAGNLALKALAVGGVFVAGGIAPKLLPALTRNDAFLKGFFAKGRFTDLMKHLHVSVALNPRAPLIGAAHYAIEH